MENLTSLDYVKLIAWLAFFKHSVILNKTQMQKLLFMCYGQALAMNGSSMFADDTPKAWPFGPVFPRSYKRYEEHIPCDLSQVEKNRFATDGNLLRMIARTVAQYCHHSATSLSDWSHDSKGPWYQTVFDSEKGTAWNRKIDDELIRSYFSNDNWRAGL